ncbi:hypothetical protein HER10_EVM0002307 [Colletotrichum scovillei]|uniref:uncharacterized protein n=1 Tax=Colletotrichum scovillei TaxID=1209932 RepID=UPI0015C34141|nr:uncharacterized protein HER10_EVM0002307 [Colletotrichum scovillei]KAF4775965.1 hypothetical protein HER10_EVM0002307 [Colletotrichum scovillei]
MKFQAILFLAASAFAAPTPEAIAEPAPADIGATTKAQRLLCSGLWTGNDLSFGDLKNIAQNGIWITYNHARSSQAKTTLKFNGAVVCSPQSSWRLKCDKA